MNDPAGYPELALSNGMPAMHSAIIGSFVWLLGLAVGSFLNVVIYRMPLGISLSQPRWSFCPHCGTTIRWFDNLPVVSWLMLRGRCRFCRTSISVQYPLIEALTALVFVLVWYLLTQLTARADMPDFNIVRDWPYLVAWLVLTACLIAVAAMDIVSYSLDIRITEFAVVAGCVLHSVWARPDFHLPVATSATGAGAAAAFVVMFFLIAVTMWRQNHAEQAPLRDEQDGFHQISEPQPADPPVSRSTSALALIAILALLGCSMLILLTPALDSISDPILPAIPPLALGIVFGVMVLAASLQRHADEEVHAAVEAEAPQARRVALQELRWLLPIILAGMGAYAVVQFVGLAGWESFVRWTPVADRPILAGLVYAMHGTIIGATVGWMLRLVFTLIFGREAFGTGDIYILGATGAIAGWDIALLALSISVGLAMVSWLISQFMKSTLMIPFGPPLALGVLFALWLHQPSSELVRFYVASLTATAREQPRLLVVLGGVMLIGTGAALLAARAVRRAFEPSVQQD